MKRRRRKPVVAMVSLGCAKNTVDAETMLGNIRDAGLRITSDPAEAEVIIVNTCGFLQAAREEAVETIREMASFRRLGRLKRIIVTGCMADRDRGILESELDSDSDRFVSPFDHETLVDVVMGNVPGQISVREPPEAFSEQILRRLPVTPVSYAYVKIADGCSNRCAYCRIPYLRGAYRSKPLDTVIGEVRELIAGGVREIDLISQDTAMYGSETAGPGDLAALLDRLVELDDLGWVRLLYLHPMHVTERVLDRVAGLGTICKYLDLPIQHVDRGVLRRMNRSGSVGGIRRIFETIRRRVPGITIRTTLMTGYPGETIRAYRELRAFVEDGLADHLGVFCFSPEPDTAAWKLHRTIESGLAEERRAELMQIQQGIVEKRNGELMGAMRVVLVDECGEGGAVGRMESQAPEVDAVVHLDRMIAPGTFVVARIEDAGPYDFFATVADGPAR